MNRTHTRVHPHFCLYSHAVTAPKQKSQNLLGKQYTATLLQWRTQATQNDLTSKYIVPQCPARAGAANLDLLSTAIRYTPGDTLHGGIRQYVRAVPGYCMNVVVHPDDNENTGGDRNDRYQNHTVSKQSSTHASTINLLPPAGER